MQNESVSEQEEDAIANMDATSDSVNLDEERNGINDRLRYKNCSRKR